MFHVQHEGRAGPNKEGVGGLAHRLGHATRDAARYTWAAGQVRASFDFAQDRLRPYMEERFRRGPLRLDFR